MKLRIFGGTAEVFYYPDILIAPARSQEQKEYWEQAKVIIEVASPSTSIVDRREKIFVYRQHAPLEEYIVIDQNNPAVLVYRRAEAWQEQVLSGDEVLRLASLGAEEVVQQIYKSNQPSAYDS